VAKVKYIKVLKCDDLEIGKSAIIEVGDKEIALFNYKGDYYAIDNICPHRGAPLGEGRIEEGILICPNHEWRFELKSGWCPQNPELSTEVYPIKVHEDKIYVRLEKPKVEGAAGTQAKTLPTDLKVKVPIILQPRNPDEEL
jgi:NAD(P)H-dependent nitrite reductase small subunit|tara:strand:+ start:112 stop:534 length:423 start_codon:yes stop_codon:yes gene_type:complete